MPLDTSVKIFHSGLLGAPVLSGTAGAMIGVLDACLVNGWGSATVDSVVISSGIATVTRGSGHPFEADMVCEVAGATVTGGNLNGERKVLSVISPSQYTIDADGIPNQTAGGTITHKVAAAGWAKAFAGTNLAAYRSADVTGLRFHLRVDDTGTQDARIRGFEVMTDINTGTGQFPTSSQSVGGFFWGKSNASDAGSRRWVLIADKKFFYLIGHWANSASASNFGVQGAFGDLAGRAGTDQYAAVCFGGTTSPVGAAPGAMTNGQLTYVTSSNTPELVVARPHTSIGGAASTARYYPALAMSSSATGESGSTSAGHIQFPNGADAGLYLSPFHISTNAVAGVYRGRLPGFFAVPQTVGANVFSHMQSITGVSGYPGRKFEAINSSTGVSFFDVTGPWV